MAVPNKPIILFPNQGIDFQTSEQSTIISGIISQINLAQQKITPDVIAQKIYVNGITDDVTFTPNASAAQLVWSYTANLSLGVNTFFIQAENSAALKGDGVIFKITLVPVEKPKINYPNNGLDFRSDIAKFNFIGSFGTGTSKINFKQNGIGNAGVFLIAEQKTWSVIDVTLGNGENLIEVTAENLNGDISDITLQKVTYISTGLPLPAPIIQYPSNSNFTIHENFTTLRGVTDPSTSTITYSLNGALYTDFKVTFQSGDRDWEAAEIPLHSGLNTIVIRASSLQGEHATATIQVNFIPPPDLFITIASPQNGEDFSTNILTQSLNGSVSPNAQKVLISIRGGAFTESGVEHTPGDVIWSYPNLQLKASPDVQNGINTIIVKAQDQFSNLSDPAQINIRYIPDVVDLVVTPPTGVRTKSFRDGVEVIWAQNPEPSVTSYNVYYSLSPGGGVDGYTLATVFPVTTPEFTEEVAFDLASDTKITGNVKTVITQEVVQKVNFFTFSPTTDPEGNAFAQGVAIYFVVTAIAFDQTTKTQLESLYSAEVSAEPLIIDQTIRDLAPRTQADILQSLIASIFSKNQTIDFLPGSVTRDIFLDPNSNEIRKLYTVLEFISEAQSFLTLRVFDDPNNDGESDPVSSSQKKQLLGDALNLNANDTQSLIDVQFDKLAGNFNVKRKAASSSQVEVVVYTLTEPTSDIIVNRGALFLTGETVGVTQGLSFEALTQAEISVAALSTFYNREAQRWEVTVPAQATQPGILSNVPAGSITLVGTGTNSPSVRCINEQAAVFGQDSETNSQLADRAALALVSVDTGTRGGYLSAVLALPNVRLAKIVSSGHQLMERDFDDVRLKHIGGKVDIYLQGDALFSYNETFSFDFPQISDEAAEIVSPVLLQIRVRNSAVTIETPVFEVLKVTNLSKKLDYDLTNVQIVGGNIIDLDETIALNELIGLDKFDSITITYRYQTKLQYILLHQPVKEIISVVGDLSGDLSRNYNLIRLDDPLLLGNSTFAQDTIEIFFDNALPLTEFAETIGLTSTDSKELSNSNVLDGSIISNNETYSIDTVTVQSIDGLTLYTKDFDYELTIGNFTTPPKLARLADGRIPDLGGDDNVLVKYFTRGSGLPVNQTQQIIDEEMTLIGESPIPTLKVGVFSNSISITNADKTRKYQENVDYQITMGSNFTPSQIFRLTSGNIPSGSVVKVTYKCAENITVRYSVNQLLQKAQDVIEEIRHVTADVIVKESFEAPIDISAAVVIKSGADEKVVENTIRTAISQHINQLKLGDRVYQSDIISLIEQQQNVLFLQWSSVTGRFNKMVRANLCFINRERIDVEYISTFTEEILLRSTLPIALTKSNVIFNSIEVTSLDKTISYILGRDYNILYGSVLIPPKIVRVDTGTIPDGSTVLVTYDSALFGVLSPPSVIITDEPHILPLNEVVSLDNVNSDATTILVRSSDRTKVYVEDLDYGVIVGNELIAPKIYLIPTGTITPGTTVLVSYITSSLSNQEIIITDEPHQLIASNPENFNNSNVEEDSISARSSSTLLVRGTDYEINSGTTTIPPQIYSLPGGKIKSGEIVFLSYKTAPFGPDQTKNVVSYITRDPVLNHNTQANGGQKIQIVPPLLEATPRIPGGNGYLINPVAIFEDEFSLALVESEDLVATAAGQGYIRGDGRIVVSLRSGEVDDRPENHIYKVNYIVINEQGSKDIITTDLEYPQLAEISLTFIEDKDSVSSNSGFIR